MSDFQSRFDELKALLGDMDPSIFYGMLAFAGLFFLIGFIVFALFCWSIYKGLKLVPEDNLMFPRYFVWFMLIPFIGVIFFWLVLPFNVPTSFARTVQGNEKALDETRTLKRIGLTYTVCLLLPYLTFVSFIPTFIAGLANLVIFIAWILYWIKVVSFRKCYLENR